MYPSKAKQINNVVEASRKVKVDNWCRFGRKHCSHHGTHEVRPFKCLGAYAPLMIHYDYPTEVLPLTRMLISIVTRHLNLCIIRYTSNNRSQKWKLLRMCSAEYSADGSFLVGGQKRKLLRMCWNMLSFWNFWNLMTFFVQWGGGGPPQKSCSECAETCSHFGIFESRWLFFS